MDASWTQSSGHQTVTPDGQWLGWSKGNFLQSYNQDMGLETNQVNIMIQRYWSKVNCTYRTKKDFVKEILLM